ncbi:MAG: radical SAM family RiPP maturation amino acid epimerase [Rhodopila sp.]|jgi:radical SAM family RiPP maturation amino acid epimerase
MMKSIPQPNAPGLNYRTMMERRSAGELHEIAHLKRFLEVWSADPEVRAEYHQIAVSGGSFDALRLRLNSEIDIAQLTPIVVPSLAHIRQSPELRNYPLGLVWHHYIRDMIRHRDLMLPAGQSGGRNPGFDAWRLRQIQRLRGELGANADGIMHPAIAFELSDGCSVGCWFCGISAAKFRGHWPYQPNQDAWRAILDHTVDFFGPAAATGFCYWATDPSDNPDYPDFLLDFYKATGSMPQTTTAAPLKNVELTRRVMALYDQYRTVTNRFSILNRKYLQRVHAAFTADELLGVELVIQAQDSHGKKSLAGRAMEKAGTKKEKLVSDSTIACVSGFLVNLPLGRVQVVTPTRATPEVPNGYYILGERFFKTPDEYGLALRELGAEHMVADLKADDRLTVRPDFRIDTDMDGLTLSDNLWLHSINGPLGEMLRQSHDSGPVRVSEVVGHIAERGGNVLGGIASLEKLFARGILQEQGMLGHYMKERQEALVS